MTYKKLRIFLRNLREFETLKQYSLIANRKNSLQFYLLSLKQNPSFEERVEIIVTIFSWITNVEFLDSTPEKTSASKIKQLFEILDKNPALFQKLKSIFSSTLNEVHSTEFFCELGLHSNVGLIGELIEKLTLKLLPDRPIGNQLSELMMAAFPNDISLESLKSIDENSLSRFNELFQGGDYSRLDSDIDDSLIYLISQITAIGLSPGIRKRIPHDNMKSLPFYSLPAKLNLYLKTKNKNEHELNRIILEELNSLLDECFNASLEVYQHLKEYGVSTEIVFQLEKMKLFLRRAQFLLEITTAEKIDSVKIVRFISELIEQNQKQKNALSIFSDNATLLAQKIIENNSQTGEHYIAKDRAENWQMVKKAIGGGVLTAGTVYLKNFILQIGISPLLTGIMASLNYAGSFLIIQFSGFTLATKQPAVTASALAQKLEKIGDRDDVESVTDEIINITRTQITAVFGNIIAVIPMSILISVLWYNYSGKWIFSSATADYTLASTSLFGPSIIYAVFTGFLLWFSSVVSGWALNWYSFHQLSYLLTENKKVNFILGKEGTSKLVNFLEHSLIGLVGNISLGIFLGFIPSFLNSIGIPLDVRHVTLSAGALAASIPVLGTEILYTLEFLLAVLGILLIGTLNISVSFALALFIAFRAKKISSHKKFLIYRSVIRRFYYAPFTFFIP